MPRMRKRIKARRKVLHRLRKSGWNDSGADRAKEYRAETDATGLHSPLDSVLRLTDATGRQARCSRAAYPRESRGSPARAPSGSRRCET